MAAGRIESDGNAGVTYKSGGADFAEYLPNSTGAAELAPGSIVAVRHGEVVGQGIDGEQYLVVTDQAVVAGNSPRDGATDTYTLVSFIGQIPVRVLGPVDSGDYILATEEADGVGTALPAAEIPVSDLGRVIGRAWEGSDDPGVKRVNTAVGLDQSGLLVPVLQRLDEENRALRAHVDALTERMEALEAR